MNFAGNRLSPWLGHIMESEQETPRPLLTPGEILQLPGDDALVMIGGLPPYRAKKLMYYQDERFRERAWLPAPDDPDEQYAELLKKGECNSWFDPAVCKVKRVEVTSWEVIRNNAVEFETELPDEDGPTEDRAFLHRDDSDDFSHEETIPENTLSVEDAVINRNGSQLGRAPIIDLSRTPQGGHLPL
jgi:type IV secretion system protein VirD4